MQAFKKQKHWAMPTMGKALSPDPYFDKKYRAYQNIKRSN